MHTFEFVKEAFEMEPDFLVKRMFGCQALCLNYQIVLVLADDESLIFKGKTYPLPIWYGVLIPTSQEFHKKLIKLFPNLQPHPFLKKWLFLSGQDDLFEETCEQLIDLIKKGTPLIGVPLNLKR